MRQTHRGFDFLQVFAMVICLPLLLLPQMSYAGGLGDLFPGDLVDKIKSTDLKDIFRPSEKNKKAPDSAPAQDNSAPVAVVEEKEAAKPVKASTPPAVAASPAVAKEVEEVKAWCYKKALVRIQNDCECVASEFIVERQTYPNEAKLNLVGGITGDNKCPNYEGIREFQYKQCINSRGYNKFPSGNEAEDFCQCVGGQIAESVVAHKGEPGASRPNKFSRLAIVQCRKAEANQ